jgi:tRNA (guanine37-N1)-methyltransferase
MIKRARERGLVNIRLTNIRDFADNRYHRVDDRPYGGGPGMVMMTQPIAAAIRHVRTPQSRVIYLTPQGRRLTAAKCRQLAQESHLVLLCGHYEGIDQRVLDQEVDEEISIGDYVLTNGCLAAIVMVDSIIRFMPGVLGHALAVEEDSFEKGLLDYPHYTRPEIFEGHAVPPILLSGNHQEIAKWRREQALRKTREIRPDLLH